MRNGFRILDSDIHVIEPGTLFEDYLDGPFRSRMPVMRRSDVTGVDTWVIEGQVFPIWNEWPEFAQANAALKRKKEQTPFQVKAFSQGFDAATTLEAMDMEGVDVAALFRTNGGTWILGLDDLDPEYAAALCRAYNDWMRDYCNADPERLKGVALLPLQAIDLAVEEARRAVNELGFVGVTVHPEPVNGACCTTRRWSRCGARSSGWARRSACTGPPRRRDGRTSAGSTCGIHPRGR